jgi:hypothetical protein
LCAKCNDATNLSSPERITFNNKFYHHDCFVCALCSKPMSGTQARGFTLTDDGHPQCSQCDLALAKRCYACDKSIIEGDTITFDTKAYHTLCFRCGQCHKSLADGKGLYTHNSKPYCTTCHNENFAPRCFKCSQPVNGQYTTFKGQSYHTACLVCVKCHRAIESTETIYDTELGFVCITCGV